MNLGLLKSLRFWQLGLGALGAGLAVYASTHNVLLAISAAITFWSTGSVTVRTVDRNSGVEQTPPPPEDTPPTSVGQTVE